MSTVSIALKEWAVLADALRRGEILALIRKGGIREQRAGFDVRHERFLIYPTYFHEKRNELAERFHASLDDAHARRPTGGLLHFELVADAVAVWRVTELDRLRRIAGTHGMSWAAVESRFRYRDRPYVHVIGVRVSRLPAAVLLPEQRRYLGCVSWVKLDTPVEIGGAEPILPGDELRQRIARLAEELGEPEDRPLDVQRAGISPARD